MTTMTTMTVLKPLTFYHGYLFPTYCGLRRQVCNRLRGSYVKEMSNENNVGTSLVSGFTTVLLIKISTQIKSNSKILNFTQLCHNL